MRARQAQEAVPDPQIWRAPRNGPYRVLRLSQAVPAAEQIQSDKGQDSQKGHDQQSARALEYKGEQNCRQAHCC
jgi:hypothetical protein